MEPLDNDLPAFMDLITRQAKALDKLIKALTNGKNTKVITEETAILHELEDQGDALLGKLIAELFAKTHDVKEIILRKDLYEMLEDVTDYYRDAGNVGMSILLKHS